MSKLIRTGETQEQDSTRAAHQLCDQLQQDTLGLMVFFCSPTHDLDAIANALSERLPRQPVVGCTTAGEIGPNGYLDNGISGFSISAEICNTRFKMVAPLKDFEIAEGQAAAESLVESFRQGQETTSCENCFALSLIDGLSMREEPLIRSIHSILQTIPLIGGLNFNKTYIYYDGAFHTDCGLFGVVKMERKIKAFKSQHFESTHERMVITDAILEKRIVTEINGLPAAEEYARMVNLDLTSLEPQVFAAFPVVVRIGGEEFVRSIQQVNADGSLTFYCAIDIGVVLSVAKAIDSIANLEHTMEQIRKEIGTPELIIGCDCILRRLEFAAAQQMDQISEILVANHLIGFNTYGEQFNGMHVNQTLTGLAIAADVQEDENLGSA